MGRTRININKKGAAFTIETIGIVVLCLLILAFGVTPAKLSYNMINEKFFGGKGFVNWALGNENDTFIPGHGHITLDVEKQKVIDSANSLVCAINTISTKDFDIKNNNVCPQDNIFFNEKSVRYGSVDVNCRSQVEPVFSLSSDEKTAIAEIGRSIINCWDNSNQVSEQVYCNKIFTSNINDDVSISERDIQDWLRTRGHVGIDIVGDGMTNINNFAWDVIGSGDNKRIKKNSPESIVVYSYAPYFGRNQIHIDEFKDVESYLGNKSSLSSVSSECTINNFELPQEVNPDGKNLADWSISRITNANDPDYLFYYESFPIGEEVNWQISKGSFFTDVILWGGLMNAVPFIGPAAKGIKAGASKLVKEGFEKLGKNGAKKAAETGFELVVRASAEKAGKSLTRTAAVELTQALSKDGYETILKLQLLYKSLIAADIPENIAEGVAKAMLERITFYKNLGKTFEQATELAQKDILDNLDALAKIDVNYNTYSQVLRDSMIKNIDIVKQPLNIALKESLERQQKIRGFLNDHVIDMVDDGTGAFVIKGTKNIDNMLVRTAERELAVELSEEANQQLTSKALNYFDDMVVKEIVDESSEEVIEKGVLGFGKDLANKGYKSFVDDFATFGKRIAESNNFDNWIRFLTGLSPERRANIMLKSRSSGGMKQLAKEFSPIQLRWTKPNGVKGVITLPFSVVLRSMGATYWQTGKMANELIWKNRLGRYAAAYVIAEELARQDAVNNKYLGQGYNSFIVNQPYLFDANDRFDLHPSAQNYFINLNKETGDNSRFFLASPCKTDLQVVETTCSCDLEPGSYLLNNQNVEPEYISFNDNSRINEVYDFDKIDDDQELEEVDRICIKYPGMQYNYTYDINDKCANVIAKDPKVASKFLRFVYDEVYVPAVGFIKKSNLTTDLNRIGKNTFFHRKEFPAYEMVKQLYQETFPSGLIGLFSSNDDLLKIKCYNEFSYLVGKIPDRQDGASLYGPQMPDEFKPSAYLSQPIMKKSGNEYKFVENPVSFEEFVDIVDINPKAIRQFNMQLEKIKSQHSSYINKDFLGLRNKTLVKDSYLYDAARKTYFNYKIIDPNTVDSSKAVKACSLMTVSSKTTQGILSLQNKDNTKGMSTVPCINIVPSGIADKYKGTYNGYNYCYSGDHTWISVWKWTFNGVAVAIDVGVAFTGVGLIVEAPVAILTGSAAAYASNWLDEYQYWPNH